MANVSVPNTFSPNTTISSSEVNANFSTIYNEFNGNISAANLANNAVTTAKIADGAVTADKLASGIVDSGWISLAGTFSVASGYNAGNKSFTIDTTSDQSGVVSPGMRFKVTRGTTAPTQCTDLEASSSQYASKSSPTGITFTDDFTCEAWVKLESYAAGTIVSRTSTPGTNGFRMYVGSDGTLVLNGGGEYITSYQSLPRNRWVHVAVSLDMSGNAGLVYIDGVNVPGVLSGSGTSLTQAGNLQVGAGNSTTFFDGKIADVRVWSAVRTATEIQDNMFQQLVGNETNLVAYFKLNGDFNDSTSNANNLTASGSATATDTDNPFSDTEYGIVTAVDSSTVTIFTGTDHGIPNMTLSAPSYSTQSTPFGFPRGEGKWTVETLINVSVSQIVASATAYYVQPVKLITPIGNWRLSYEGVGNPKGSTNVSIINGALELTDSAINYTDSSSLWGDTRSMLYLGLSTGATNQIFNQVSRSKLVNLATQTTYSMAVKTGQAGGTYQFDIRGDQNTFVIRAECAYV